MPVAPRRIHVRMYQVGFGDCFLLSFDYGQQLRRRRVRHVLIDFGTNRLAPGVSMTEVARQIASDCGGRLDAVVATHRHKDHLSAFGAGDTGRILDELAPDLVVRPWTEDPRRPAGARDFLSTLDRAQSFAEVVEARLASYRRGSMLGDLGAFAADQVTNRKAIDRLNAWARAGEGEYLSIGDATRLERVLPGVGVRVLGPPTVKDWPDVLHERREDPQYWLRFASAVRRDRVVFETALPARPEVRAGPAGLAADAEDGAVEERTRQAEEELQTLRTELADLDPGPVRWLLEKMRAQQRFVVHRLVRLLDDVLNNTSVILLLEVGEHRLLFSGDAQIENWEYLLTRYPRRASILEELRRVDLYKVGHHGSRNATPKLGLYGLWSERRKGELTSLLSTKQNVYPGKTAATRVPRSALIQALRARGQLFSTHQLPRGRVALELRADAARRGFTRVP